MRTLYLIVLCWVSVAAFGIKGDLRKLRNCAQVFFLAGQVYPANPRSSHNFVCSTTHAWGLRHLFTGYVVCKEQTTGIEFGIRKDPRHQNTLVVYFPNHPANPVTLAIDQNEFPVGEHIETYPQKHHMLAFLHRFFTTRILTSLYRNFPTQFTEQAFIEKETGKKDFILLKLGGRGEEASEGLHLEGPWPIKNLDDTIREAHCIYKMYFRAGFFDVFQYVYAGPKSYAVRTKVPFSAVTDNKGKISDRPLHDLISAMGMASASQREAIALEPLELLSRVDTLGMTITRSGLIEHASFKQRLVRGRAGTDAEGVIGIVIEEAAVPQAFTPTGAVLLNLTVSPVLSRRSGEPELVTVRSTDVELLDGPSYMDAVLPPTRVL